MGPGLSSNGVAALSEECSIELVILETLTWVLKHYATSSRLHPQALSSRTARLLGAWQLTSNGSERRLENLSRYSCGGNKKCRKEDGARMFGICPFEGSKQCPGLIRVTGAGNNTSWTIGYVRAGSLIVIAKSNTTGRALVSHYFPMHCRQQCSGLLSPWDQSFGGKKVAETIVGDVVLQMLCFFWEREIWTAHGTYDSLNVGV